MAKKIRPVLSKESFEELEDLRQSLKMSISDKPRETYEEYLRRVESGEMDCWLA